eukprot:scaffold7149_cov121-Isochrysis_galbana.AAC.1
MVRRHASVHLIPWLVGVGECLVGRHGSGVAVERCAVFGAVRAGSVWLQGFCVVGRWVGLGRS